MIDFELFRVKVYPSAQMPLPRLAQELSPQLALFDAIRRAPSVEWREGYTWHIGNIERIDAFGMYFRLGRTSLSIKSLYDETRHEFVESNEVVAPSTHVFCDTSLEVCGIGKQRELAPEAIGIARQLERLLNATTDESTGYRFEIGTIRDPADFLEEVQNAFAVLDFSFTFALPNAWDAHEFQEPLEEYAKAARARKGRVEIKGSELDKIVVENVARAAAASGHEAKAKIRPTKKAKPVTRYLKKGNPASVKGADDVTGQQSKESLLERIRQRYDGIRGRDKS